MSDPADTPVKTPDENSDEADDAAPETAAVADGWPEAEVEPATDAAAWPKAEADPEPAPEPLPAPEPAPPEAEARTVFAPTSGFSQPPETPAPDEATRWVAPSQPPAPQPAPPPPPAAVTGGPFASGVSRATAVGPGVVLNNIYEVKRFLARGGMGEVYEGFNVNTDERVAIKVMLPALAADPHVQQMFRKEARTLTKLHHPAVVQYRVLAQEPQLDVFYIVTEFIDGAALSDMLPQLNATPEDLARLTRRLAEGLGAAHALGAVHRDISPDNVLVPDRELQRAKIIDFGIAKDMDPSKGTIVGDGFAGKLGFVAPEQFGDYDREVGPWTDVYSLGLVILAVVERKNVDMGATLVEAIDKRRAGPDLSRVPDLLRPVLAGMLTADPKQRFRSMEAVIEALDAVGAPGGHTRFTPGVAAAPEAPEKPNRMPMIIGGGVGALLALGAITFFALSGPKSKAPENAAPVDARRPVAAVLPGVGCSWLDLDTISTAANGLSVKLSGVAGRPAAAQVAISGAAAQSGLALADLDLADVAPVGEPVCDALDTLRAFRTTGGSALSTAQKRFEIVPQSNGKTAARAVITMTPGNPATDFTLVGLEPTGQMDVIFPNRAALRQFMASQDPSGGAVSDLGGDSYRLQIDTDHEGWSGMLLITGKEPFDPALLSGLPQARGPQWPDKFRAAATAGGWKTDMVWYRTVKPGER